MLTFKKIIGFCVIAFIAVPLLFGMIWAYGLTRAVTSPDFISSLPDVILEDLPFVVEDIAKEIDSRCYDVDEDSRLWLKAFRDRGTDLNHIIRETGIESWLHNDVRKAFLEIGGFLRGDRGLGTVELNMRPLKTALKSPVLLDELVAVIEKLPACSPVDEVWWEDQAERAIESEGRMELKLKPCRPANLESIRGALALYLENEVEDISDSVELMHVEGDLPRGLDVAKWLSQFLLLLFVVPALFIFLGALIASDSRPSFLRWVGASTFVGGGLVFLLTSTVIRLLPNLVIYQPDFQLEFHGGDCIVPSLLSYLTEISQHFLQPVNKVATIICVIGIVVVALSFAYNEKKA